MFPDNVSAKRRASRARGAARGLMVQCRYHTALLLREGAYN